MRIAAEAARLPKLDGVADPAAEVHPNLLEEAVAVAPDDATARWNYAQRLEDALCSAIGIASTDVERLRRRRRTGRCPSGTATPSAGCPNRSRTSPRATDRRARRSGRSRRRLRRHRARRQRRPRASAGTRIRGRPVHPPTSIPRQTGRLDLCYQPKQYCFIPSPLPNNCRTSVMALNWMTALPASAISRKPVEAEKTSGSTSPLWKAEIAKCAACGSPRD